MIDPFDSEFLSQELRDAWKKIEELEEENKKLKEEIVGRDDSIMYSEQVIKELKETNERLLKYVRELEEDLGFHRPNTGYKPQ